MPGTHNVVVDDFGAADEDLVTVLLLLSIRWLDIVSEASLDPAPLGNTAQPPPSSEIEGVGPGRVPCLSRSVLTSQPPGKLRSCRPRGLRVQSFSREASSGTGSAPTRKMPVLLEVPVARPGAPFSATPPTPAIQHLRLRVCAAPRAFSAAIAGLSEKSMATGD